MDVPNPDDQPTVEADAAEPPPAAVPAGAALPGENPDRLREQARQLHEEAGDRARAAGELRDAAAALRDQAAALLERVPELAAEAPPLDDAEAPAAEPISELPAEDATPRRRWLRRRD